MPEAVVLDASAILDASSPGPAFDLLSSVHERFAPKAPALVAWELGSVVHGKRARSYGGTPSQRANALELMLAGIELVPTDEGRRAATGALAAQYGLTFYDASYLALAAEDPTAVLITQDGGLLKAASRALGAERATGLEGIPALLARAGP